MSPVIVALNAFPPDVSIASAMFVASTYVPWVISYQQSDAHGMRELLQAQQADRDVGWKPASTQTELLRGKAQLKAEVKVPSF
jgi:hypothetical protein